MQVLKFGGSSVANADNINKVVAIVQKSSQKDKTVLVVSALGGVTDLLISAARLASNGDESYAEQLSVIEKKASHRGNGADSSCSSEQHSQRC